MKIHRFISNFDLSRNTLEITDKEIVNQMKNVLKLKAGGLVELCDGKDISAMAEIVEINKDKIVVKKAPTPKGVRVPTTSVGKNFVTLFCSILKKENFELVVQKTTECGVLKIIPIITSRTIKTGLNMERLRKIAKEASEQCGRITIPEILEPITFPEALKNIQGETFFFDSSGDYSFITHTYSPASELLCSARQPAQCVLKKQSPDSFNLFIGPEGGWTEEEINMTKSLNFKNASLGPLTLRGETAAIIATYLVSNMIK
jgi:16S rRNA (uracil1498-N3)-methyltransferase